MSKPPSDALVVFGVTGDLAHKKILPALHALHALHALARRGELDVPVLGVARSAWTDKMLRARLRDSVASKRETDEGASARLCARMRYVSGDYQAAATYAQEQMS